jgi:hypothetical protein
MDKDRISKIKDERSTQRIIDPSTGKDVTGEYVNQRLRELENVADDIIKDALKELQEHEADKVNIYQKNTVKSMKNLEWGLLALPLLLLGH